jgi:hypothetical protein
MTNENEERPSEEKKTDKPVFERRLKDVRVVCWRNETQEGRVWFHATVGRTYRKNDTVHEAPGSLNGLPDIALAIAGLEAAKRFIEQQTEA